jgi:signal transduction histidine kinase
MSHELRTPLNAIIGFAQLLHDGRVDLSSGQAKEFIGDILTSGRHLLRLINDILDLAKVEAGRLSFKPVPFNLRRGVSEVATILRTQAALKSIVIAIEHDPSVNEIEIDPGRFKQVLYNYLSNALKFTPDGGQIVIRVRAEPSGWFRLEVNDSGVGISAEDQALLFREFNQLERGARRDQQGTGLGLALTKRLVEAQGGTVGVESEIGRGSSFWARLPCHYSPSSN